MFTLKFGDYEFPNQTFEVDGFGLSNSAKEENIILLNGSEVQDPYLKGRTFKIVGIIHNSAQATSLAQLSAMQTALFNGKQDFQHLSDRVLPAYTTKFTPKPQRGSDQSIFAVEITMLAPIPYFVSAGASVSEVFSIVGTTLLNINIPGDVLNYPKIYITASGGTINDDVSLQNITSEQTIRYRGTINNGEAVEVDSGVLDVFNNSVRDIENFEGSFIDLLPGTNTFLYVGATCQLEILYKSRWY